MRKLIFLLSTLFIFSCGSGDDDSTQPLLPPEAALLTSPENNKVCETGTSISDSKSNVDFSWSASANTTTYDLKITNLSTNEVSNQSGVTETTTTVELSKGTAYSWQITSKNNESTENAVSSTWKFYLAGSSETTFAPFPADLISPTSGSTIQRDGDGMVTLSWAGTDPDTSSGLKYTVYLDTVDGKQDPLEDHKDLDDSELTTAVDSDTVYYWRVKTSDGTNVSYSLIYSFRIE